MTRTQWFNLMGIALATAGVVFILGMLISIASGPEVVRVYQPPASSENAP